MAKIRKINFFTRDQVFEAQLEYTPEAVWLTDGEKEKFFYVPLQHEWQVLLINPTKALIEMTVEFRGRGKNIVAVYGKTEEKAVERFEKYMELFAKETTKIERVILYRFAYESRNLLQDEDMYPSDEAKLELDFRVCTKKTFGRSIQYLDSEDRIICKAENVQLKITDHNTWIELPHSEEDEKFFTDLYKAMETLMLKFNKHLGTKDAITKTLASKVLLLGK